MKSEAPTSSEEPDSASHDRWFRAKVREAMTSGRPLIPHAEAMAKVASIVDEKRRRRIHAADSCTDGTEE